MSSYQNELNSMIPILLDAHKKRPLEPRMEKLQELISIVKSENFINYEPYIVQDILSIIIKRLDDKPKIMEIANELGELLISKLSIQSFFL